MPDEPAGFESAAERTRKLIGANAFLARRQKEHGLQPMAQGYVRRFKDRADLHGKWLTALVALVRADPRTLAPHLGNAIYPAAMGANRPIWPKQRFNPGISGLFVVEALVGNGRFHG